MMQIITPEEARRILQESREIDILDVRTPNEFKEEHLEKAININFYDHDFPEKMAKLSRNKKYLVYCHSGGRAVKTGELMEELGFKEVLVVEGTPL